MTRVNAAAVLQRALRATLGLSTLGILTVWFGPCDPSSPVPAVASAASALMLINHATLDRPECECYTS